MEAQHRRRKIQSRYAIPVLAVGLSLIMAACGEGSKARINTIGVICYHLSLEPLFQGFKAGMTELGYIEGKSVAYVYNGPVKPDPDAIDSEIKRLLARKVDLFYTTGTLPTLRAKNAVKGKKTVVIFAPVINPVTEGVVESLRRPGGNVTGVQSGSSIPKAMEWLLKLAPKARKVYVPYNPKDEVSVTSIAALREASAMLGVELMLDEVNSLAQVAAAVEKLPKGTVFFVIPTPSIGLDGGLFKAAARRGIAVGSNLSYMLEPGALVTYATNYFSMGKQAARLADQIFRGASPADLPVETAEYFLSINLKTASALGIDVPDEILEQANSIIR